MFQRDMMHSGLQASCQQWPAGRQTPVFARSGRHGRVCLHSRSQHAMSQTFHRETHLQQVAAALPAHHRIVAHDWAAV
jgi:hypothetical protein